jgi:hypothetical protein
MSADAMFISALVTKWSDRGIVFQIEKFIDKFEITACIKPKQKYLNIISSSAEEGCKVIDEGLEKEFNEIKEKQS